MIAAETETQSFGYASAFFAPFADVRTVLCPWPIASSRRSDLIDGLYTSYCAPFGRCCWVMKQSSSNEKAPWFTRSTASRAACVSSVSPRSVLLFFGYAPPCMGPHSLSGAPCTPLFTTEKVPVDVTHTEKVSNMPPSHHTESKVSPSKPLQSSPMAMLMPKPCHSSAKEVSFASSLYRVLCDMFHLCAPTQPYFCAAGVPRNLLLKALDQAAGRRKKVSSNGGT